MHVASDIAPWSPYLAGIFPRSAGRVALAEALTDHMMLTHGHAPEDLAAAHGEPGDARIREQVAAAARLIGRQLLEDRFTAWARPIGGGEPVAIPATAWELDDFVPRFATCALDLRRPFDPASPPTHRIFIDGADLEAIRAACFHDIAPTRAERAIRPTSPVPTEEPGFDVAAPGPDRLIRLPEVERMVGMKRSTIYDRIREDRFPGQINPGSRPALWRESEVRAWVAEPR